MNLSLRTMRAHSVFPILMASVAVFTLLPRIGLGLNPLLFWFFVILIIIFTALSSAAIVVRRRIKKHRTASPDAAKISYDIPSELGDEQNHHVLNSRAWLFLSLILWFGWIIVGFVHFGGFPLPPNDDAIHHINQISNIWRYKSLELEAIYGNVSALALNPSSAFYPHGTHLLASGSVWIFGDPARGIALFYFFISQMMYPFGLYLMVRSFSLFRFWALLISIFGVSIGLIPYGPISWGGIPILTGIVGLSFGVWWLNGVHHHSQVLVRKNQFLWFFKYDIPTVIKTIAVVLGLGVIHPTSGFLFLTYFLILEAVDKERTPWWRLSAIGALVFTVVFPWLSFIPGARSVRNLGEIDPFFGDSYRQLGEILFLAPYSPFSYWHLIFLPVVAVLYRLLVQKTSAEKDIVLPSTARRGRFDAAILFALYLWLLQVSALMTSRGSLGFLSWPTSLWYRQYARTSYHLPMAVVLVLVVIVLAGETSRTSPDRSRSPAFFTRTGAIALVMLFPVVGGLVTVWNHSSSFLDIGPFSNTTYDSASQELAAFQEKSGSDDLFLISDFNSGISLLSVGLSIPSSSEPYGREDVAGGVHSLISSNASLKDLSSFLNQWGDSVVVTNSRARRPVLSENFIDQSGMFERVFEADGVVGWQLRKTAVRVITDLPPRTDLYDGRVLSSSADGLIRLVVESLDAGSSVSTTFDVLQPTCAPLEWDLEFSNFSTFEVSSIPVDFGVRVQVSGMPPVGVSEHQLVVSSNGCQMPGDTGAIKALVSFPVAEMG